MSFWPPLMCTSTAELSAPPTRHILFPPLSFTFTCRCGQTLVLFIAGLCGCMSTTEAKSMLVSWNICPENIVIFIQEVYHEAVKLKSENVFLNCILLHVPHSSTTGTCNCTLCADINFVSCECHTALTCNCLVKWSLWVLTMSVFIFLTVLWLTAKPYEYRPIQGPFEAGMSSVTHSL